MVGQNYVASILENHPRNDVDNHSKKEHFSVNSCACLSRSLAFDIAFIKFSRTLEQSRSIKLVETNEVFHISKLSKHKKRNGLKNLERKNLERKNVENEKYRKQKNTELAK